MGSAELPNDNALLREAMTMVSERSPYRTRLKQYFTTTTTTTTHNDNVDGMSCRPSSDVRSSNKIIEHKHRNVMSSQPLFHIERGPARVISSLMRRGKTTDTGTLSYHLNFVHYHRFY